MILSAAFSSQAHLADLAADAPALANDRHASERRADLVICAAAALTLTFGGTTSLLRTDPSLNAAGVAALVLRRAAHQVNAAGLVSATHCAAD